MGDPEKQTISWFPGIWLALASVLFILAWRFTVATFRSPHSVEIANEIGSIAQSKEGVGTKEIVPSNNGERLVYFQETDTGIGTYFIDTKGGKPKLLFEQNEAGYTPVFGMLAWSPNDRLFACCVQSSANPKRPRKEIVLYDGNTGDSTTKVPADAFFEDSKFIWLGSDSFAYSSYNNAWVVFERKPDGTWFQSKSVRRFYEGEMKNLTVLSPHFLSWHDGSNIFRYDFSSGAIETMWSVTNDTIHTFVYEKDMEQLSVFCTQLSGSFWCTLQLPRLWEKQAVVISTNESPQRSRYADLTLEDGKYCFNINPEKNTPLKRFVWEGMVEDYRIAEGYIYFSGNEPNGPPGIWKYDIKSNIVESIASGLKKPLKHTTMATPKVAMLTNASGRKFSYHVWEPIHLSKDKKYPVIIGQTHYMWFTPQQVAANSGYYFATGDRLSWWNGLEHWGEDVTDIYHSLVQNPNIDTNRVFLIATSAETGSLSQLVGQTPELWKGAILFSPVSQPPLIGSHLKSILMLSGSDDGYSGEQFGNYQDQAAKAGVSVELLLEPGVQHITRSLQSEKERDRALVEFLNEN